ncbi:MAG TPA: aldehyde dehydrogenase family protein [Vicinamibacteria bacterium]|nr:aldehyde dehydrogenase family protein [Vicinamibacteria bacterium]
MTALAPDEMKVTYTTSAADMDKIHRAFDEALVKVRSDCGKDYPIYINGKEVRSDAPLIVDTSPIDTELVLGRFTSGNAEHVHQAVESAYLARRDWEKLGWKRRVEIMRKAAELVRKSKFELAALMSLEVGKSRLESLGDAEESADLIDYYAWQMENANGFQQKMNKLTPIEDNTDLLRPFGVFVCISPFNFPLALACGMSSAALVAGNTLVFKPAQDTPWTGLRLYHIYREAGVPGDVLHFLTGRGSVIGDALWQHPKVAGVVFTGSKEVGMHIFKGFSTKWAKPCLTELGGKNPCIVMDSADLDAAAEGVMKSAWGLQNQKCSACSRVYVHEKVASEFTKKLIEKTKAMTVGDPTERDVFFGPVINERAVKTFERAVDRARKDGEILMGGRRLTEGAFARGYYVEPTIARVPLSSEVFMEEYFVPFLAIGEIDSLERAIEESNKAEYGLTAGIFSGKQEEIEQFFDEIEAGVTYANKRSGATTGAWPGAQPFCGWKGSGSSGKGGCGPYYVMQFMREQSRTVIEE